MNKQINLKELSVVLTDEALCYIASENEESMLYFNEKSSSYEYTPKYEKLKCQLQLELFLKLEELGFKHKE